MGAVGVDGKGRRRVVVSVGRGGIGRHLGGGIQWGKRRLWSGCVTVMVLRLGDRFVEKASPWA